MAGSGGRELEGSARVETWIFGEDGLCSYWGVLVLWEYGYACY